MVVYRLTCPSEHISASPQSLPVRLVHRSCLRARSLQVSGTKFYYLRNEGVLLEMALINWALAQLMQKGFTPVTTPDLVRSNVVEKCGFQPRASNTQVRAEQGFLRSALHWVVHRSVISRLPTALP